MAPFEESGRGGGARLAHEPPLSPLRSSLRCTKARIVDQALHVCEDIELDIRFVLNADLPTLNSNPYSL